jgi:hypothetical protein
MSGYTTLSFKNLSFTRDGCTLKVSSASPASPVTVFTPGASGNQGCVIPTLNSLSASDWNGNRMLISGVSQYEDELEFSFFYWNYPTSSSNSVPILVWTAASFDAESQPPADSSTFCPLTGAVGPFNDPLDMVIEGVGLYVVTQGILKQQPPPPMIGFQPPSGVIKPF